MRLASLREKFEASKENVRAGLACGFLVSCLGLFLLAFPSFLKIGQFLAERSYDLPLILRDDGPFSRWLSPVAGEAVLIFMDEDSHQQLSAMGLRASYNRGWDRARTHGALLRRLKEEGAKAIVFDIVFNEPSEDPAEDREFASILSGMTNVVFGADRAPQTQTGAGDEFLPPADVLLEALTHTNMDALVADMGPMKRVIGNVLMEPDPDLSIRMHPNFRPADYIYPLSWTVAALAGAPVTRDTNEWLRTRYVNYYGAPGTALRSVPYWRVLDTNQIPRGYFRDKFVFVGSSVLTRASGERKDAYKSIYPRVPSISGVEVQATLFLNLYRGDWLRRFTPWQHGGMVLCAGVFGGMGLMLLRPARAVLAGGCLMLLLVIAAFVTTVFFRYTFTWMVPVVQIAAATLASVSFNSYRLHIQRKLLQQSVAMYVSPAVASAVLKQPDMMQPGARKELLSIMFTDIANFTNMSEGMDSDALARLMNNYFEAAVNRCIHPMEGTVVKYIGDAIFAIWNAPLPQPSHRELACRAAILLRDSVTDFQFSKPGLEVRTRIGLHSGTASVGNFGSTNRVDYTALGENINLTSRMEGLNKYLGTSILATGDIIEPVEEKFTTRYVGKFQLKGFARAVDVYELIGEAGAAEVSRPLREQFGQAIEAFCRRDFDAAEIAWRRVLQANPKDGPSKFYLGYIHEFRANPPPESWKGEIELKEK